MNVVNLISDTVTKPTLGMLQAMMAAQVGDDVFNTDPTVNLLQEKVADMFGMEDALFCASGTMTNQIALNVHTRPGDEVICHHYSHIYNYEGGGMMFNSGLSPRLVGDDFGQMTDLDVLNAINEPENIHAARTKMVVVENTSNKGGGTCYEFKNLKAIGKVARAHNLAYHLDGARLWNAMVLKKEDPKDYGRLFDSISVCLSKGLGCPIGSLLLGSKPFIKDAKRVRKRFGGAWRQAGYLAAAGIYALDNQIERLAEDHQKAFLLFETLKGLPYIKTITPPQTNIIIFTLKDTILESSFIDKLKEKQIYLIGMGQSKLRFVTHHDVSFEDIENTCEVLKSLSNEKFG